MRKDRQDEHQKEKFGWTEKGGVMGQNPQRLKLYFL